MRERRPNGIAFDEVAIDVGGMDDDAVATGYQDFVPFSRGISPLVLPSPRFDYFYIASD